MATIDAIVQVLKHDFTSVSVSVGAAMKAQQDYIEHPDTVHENLRNAALGVAVAAIVATGGDLAAIADDPDVAAFLNREIAENPLLHTLAGVSGLVNLANSALAIQTDWNELNENGLSDTKALLDLLANGLIFTGSVGQLGAELALATGLAPETLFLGATVEAIAGVSAAVVNGAAIGQFINSIWPYASNEGGEAVVGPASSNSGDISDGEIIVVHADAVRLQNGNISMGAYSSDANTLSDYILNSNKTITAGVELHFTGAVPYHDTLVDVAGQNLVRTYNLNGNIVKVTQSYADGSGLSMTINDHAVSLPTVGSNSFAEVNYVKGVDGGADSIIISTPGASTGTQYVLTDGVPSNSITVGVTPTASRLGSSVGLHADLSEVAGTIGSIIGSSLGNFLANGNKVEGVIYGSLLGVLGQDLAQELVPSLDLHGGDATEALPTATSNAFSSYLGQVGTQIVSAGAGLIGDTLFMQLGQDLGLDNFGSQLLGTDGVMKYHVYS